MSKLPQLQPLPLRLRKTGPGRGHQGTHSSSPRSRWQQTEFRSSPKSPRWQPNAFRSNDLRTKLPSDSTWRKILLLNQRNKQGAPLLRPHIPLGKGQRPREGRFNYSETHLSAHAPGRTTPKHVSPPKDLESAPRCLARRSFTPGDRHRRRPPASETANKA